MNLIQEYNKRYEFFRDITGEAMRVHRKFHGGLLESAYEAALKYLLEQKGYTVERQKFLPIYWDDVRLDQDYRMDLVLPYGLGRQWQYHHRTQGHQSYRHAPSPPAVELHEPDASSLRHAHQLQPRRPLLRMVLP